MMTTERSWGKYQPISEDRKARVVHYLLTCPDMSFSVIAARVGISKKSVLNISRETGARRTPKEKP